MVLILMLFFFFLNIKNTQKSLKINITPYTFREHFYWLTYWGKILNIKKRQKKKKKKKK